MKYHKNMVLRPGRLLDAEVAHGMPGKAFARLKYELQRNRSNYFCQGESQSASMFKS